jgi:hypothetical protein
MMRREI